MKETLDNLNFIMELHWMAFLVIGFLVSISAQSIYDTTHALHANDKRRINPYVQQLDRLENNDEQYLPVDYIGRSRAGKQRAILDEEKYRKLRRKEDETKKLKTMGFG